MGNALPMTRTTWIAWGAAAAVALLIGALWDFIRLPYSNPAGIVGPLDQVRFNPLNNLVRTALFVAVPAALWWWMAPPRSAGGGEVSGGRRRPELWAALLLLVGLWTVFRGTASLLAGWGPPPELFHFGELLTPAWIYQQGGGVWTGTFFAHGAFIDVFATALGWWIGGGEGPAGPIVVQAVLHSLWVPALALLLVVGGSAVRSQAGDGATVALIAWLLVGLHLGEEVRNLFHPRDAVFLVSLALLLAAVVRRCPGLWLAAGLLVPAGLFYAIDRGTYFGLTAVAVLAADVIAGGRRAGRMAPVFFFSAGLLAGCLLWLVTFGWAETRAFLENYLFWARYKDYLDSYVFPGPLDHSNPLHALLLWTALTAAVLWVVALRRSGRWEAVDQAHFCLAVAGLLLLRNALGRSDPDHLRYSIALLLCAVVFGGWRLVRRRLDRAPAVARAALAVLAVLVVAETGRTAVDLYRFIHRDLPVWTRLSSSELEYLPAAAEAAAPALREALGSEPCLFVLPSEPAWYYHLRLRPCSRFYVTWFAAPRAHQEEVIRDLERARPERILAESPYWTHAIDGIGPEDRFPVLMEYLEEKYRRFASIEGFVVHSRRP